MKQFFQLARADFGESLRARWFLVYAIVFGGVMVGLFVSGLTESRIMGFTGLSRLLVTYLQVTMAILPIFMLITTVRSVVGDREAKRLLRGADALITFQRRLSGAGMNLSQEDFRVLSYRY